MSVNIINSKTTILNGTLNVKQRLQDLEAWLTIYEKENTKLQLNMKMLP